jgi:type I restriction enzyme S subunit
MPIALPKKDEQDRIAEMISVFDLKLDNQNSNLKLKEELFKTLLHELMTGQRRVHELEFEEMGKLYNLTDEPLSMVAEK